MKLSKSNDKPKKGLKIRAKVHKLANPNTKGLLNSVANFDKDPEPPKYIKNSRGQWIDSKTKKFVKKEIAEAYMTKKD